MRVTSSLHDQGKEEVRSSKISSASGQAFKVLRALYHETTAITVPWTRICKPSRLSRTPSVALMPSDVAPVFIGSFPRYLISADLNTWFVVQATNLARICHVDATSCYRFCAKVDAFCDFSVSCWGRRYDFTPGFEDVIDLPHTLGAQQQLRLNIGTRRTERRHEDQRQKRQAEGSRVSRVMHAC